MPETDPHEALCVIEDCDRQLDQQEEIRRVSQDLTDELNRRRDVASAVVVRAFRAADLTSYTVIEGRLDSFWAVDGGSVRRVTRVRAVSLRKPDDAPAAGCEGCGHADESHAAIADIVTLSEPS